MYDVSWFQVLGSEVIVIEDSVEDDVARTEQLSTQPKLLPKMETAANLGIKALPCMKTI